MHEPLCAHTWLLPGTSSPAVCCSLPTQQAAAAGNFFCILFIGAAVPILSAWLTGGSTVCQLLCPYPDLTFPLRIIPAFPE